MLYRLAAVKAQLEPAEMKSRNIRHTNCKLVFILITVDFINTVETKIRIAYVDLLYID